MRKVDRALIVSIIIMAAWVAWLWADNHALASHNKQLSKENEQLIIQVWDLKQYLTSNN